MVMCRNLTHVEYATHELYQPGTRDRPGDGLEAGHAKLLASTLTPQYAFRWSASIL